MLTSPTVPPTPKHTDDMTKANCSELETNHEEPGVAGSNGPKGTEIPQSVEMAPISQLLPTVKLVANASPQMANKPSKGNSAPCDTKWVARFPIEGLL